MVYRVGHYVGGGLTLKVEDFQGQYVGAGRHARPAGSLYDAYCLRPVAYLVGVIRIRRADVPVQAREIVPAEYLNVEEAPVYTGVQHGHRYALARSEGPQRIHPRVEIIHLPGQAFGVSGLQLYGRAAGKEARRRFQAPHELQPPFHDLYGCFVACELVFIQLFTIRVCLALFVKSV